MHLKCRLQNEGLINSEIRLIEIMAWRHLNQVHHKECILNNCSQVFSHKNAFQKPSEQYHIVRFFVNELMRVPFTRNQDWLSVPFTRNQDWLRVPFTRNEDWLRVPFTRSQDWLGWWPGTDMASRQYFKQCRLRCLTSCGVTRRQLVQASWLTLV